MGKIDVDLKQYKSNLEALLNYVNEVSLINWNTETVTQFLKGHDIPIMGIDGIGVQYYQSFYEALNKFDYASLISNIQECQAKLNDLSKDNFDNYNEPYQAYINASLNNFNNQIILFFDTLSKNVVRNQFVQALLNELERLKKNLNLNIDRLFEYFKYGNKNYVIFGKNGAGKTTLLKHIASALFKSAVIIPANRNVIPFSGNQIYYYNNYSLNKKLEDSNSLFYLVKEINNETLKAFQAGVSGNDVLINKFYKIFNSLGLDREIIIEGESLFLYGDNISKYSLSDASDGEKSIAYLIMATLLTPHNSFLFIDEPERHLNGALLRNLFDKLEEERPDLRFVYLTHVTDFVESRKNVELIYLEKTNSFNKWNFKKISDYDDISLDVLLSIEGAKEDLIFCEGTRSSIDCKILECLYPEFEIKPVNSCEQVKLNTKGINGKETLLRRKAFGLVDNDYMQPDEIASLRKDKIFVIGYNEWENFLIRSEILEYINEHHLRKNLSMLKSDVIKYIRTQGKEAILSDFITKRYTKMIYATNLKYNSNLDKQIDVINERNKKDLLKEVEELSNRIDKSADYDELVSLVPAKMLLNSVAQKLGLSSDEDYVDFVVKYLKIDKVFNSNIKRLLNITFS